MNMDLLEGALNVYKEIYKYLKVRSALGFDTNRFFVYISIRLSSLMKRFSKICRVEKRTLANGYFLCANIKI